MACAMKVAGKGGEILTFEPFFSFYFFIAKVRSGQVRSGQVRSDQIRSGQVRSMYMYVTFFWMRHDNIQCSRRVRHVSCVL